MSSTYEGFFLRLQKGERGNVEWVLGDRGYFREIWIRSSLPSKIASGSAKSQYICILKGVAPPFFYKMEKSIDLLTEYPTTN